MTTAEKMNKLFSGLNRAHGVYEITGRKSRGKVAGKARTIAAAVTEVLWEKHLAGEQGLGIVPIKDNSKVSFAAIDIDDYSVSIEEVAKKVKKYKLPLNLCQTKSGGVHAYLFMKKETSAEIVKSRMEEWAVLLGHPGVEIFPKQSQLSSEEDVGNWINMPYFGDQRKCVVKGKELTLEQFLKYAEKNKITEKEILDIKIPQHPLLEEAPPCLQSLAHQEFPPGTRNNSLFNIGVYVRLKHGDSWEDKLEEYNRELFSSPLNHKEVSVIIKSLNRKEYFYTCEQVPLVGVCNKRLCREREFGIGCGEGEPPLLPDGVQKLLYNPPRWIVCVEGINIECDTTTLMRQDKYLRLVVEMLNRFPPAAKPAAWRKHIDQLLMKVEEVEVPEDASPFGQFRFFLETFCTGRKKAKTKEEITLGKPWTSPGERTYFRSVDFMKYLESNDFRISSRQCWSWLKENEANHSQMNISGKCIQLWDVPAYTTEAENYPVPSITDEEEF